MRRHLTILGFLGSALAGAQSVTSVYNRDTHEPFKLKSVNVESTVIGPLVKTSTVLTYDNPYKTMTEATLNFVLPDAAALGGFAYYYGDEYVRGQLMDKNKAWFIYTAITSRGRDPGIMEQWSPTDYHCQIFPIKQGSDLRIRLWTIGTLAPCGDGWELPKPTVPRAVGYEEVDPTLVDPDWTAHAVDGGQLKSGAGRYTVDLPERVSAVAQKFKDGRVYVAGLIRKPLWAKTSSLKIVGAWYEPSGATTPGADVTAKVAEMTGHGNYSIDANNHVFGDPYPGIVKQLHVKYLANGKPKESWVAENERFDLLEKDQLQPIDGSRFPSLQQAKSIQLDPHTLAFFGWLKKNHTIHARVNKETFAFKPKMIYNGNDVARLWAQQMLATGTWKHRKDVLAFSMKYGVPSNATALLAVPSAEMKLFREKEKQFEKMQAEERRRQLALERNRRNWAAKRNQNWNSSQGGDPEIRVSLPGAVRAEAILPDRRVIALKADGDVWGGNFEIPANAAEGVYTVRVVGYLPDGSAVERSWIYNVDRTPPKGEAHFVRSSGHLVLEVRSEPKLAEVAAYGSDGRRWVLTESSPGVYRVEIPVGAASQVTVVMKDMAGNKGEIVCSLPR